VGIGQVMSQSLLTSSSLFEDVQEMLFVSLLLERIRWNWLGHERVSSTSDALDLSSLFNTSI
jgi:hypothetical protein